MSAPHVAWGTAKLDAKEGIDLDSRSALARTPDPFLICMHALGIRAGMNAPDGRTEAHMGKVQIEQPGNLSTAQPANVVALHPKTKVS